jgi:hypothetical protein
MLPELLTAALKATFPPVVVKVRTLVGVELETALLTVMAPVLLSVADPLANRVCSVVGVIFEVPDVLVYQVPLNHSPPVSVVPVATVIADGRPLVVTEVDEADQVPVPRFVTGAT